MRVRGGWPSVVVALLLSMIGSPRAGAGMLPTADPVLAGISHGRLVGPVAMDGGRLVVIPARRGTYPVESAREADWDQKSSDAIWTGHFGFADLQRYKVYGRVTVARNLRRDDSGDSSQALAGIPTPGFHDRLAWVIFERYTTVSSQGSPCPAAPAGHHPVPYPTYGWHVFILDGKDHQRALDYDEPVGYCGPPTSGPQVSIPQRSYGLPWQQTGLSGRTLTYTYTVPACGTEVPTVTSSTYDFHTHRGHVDVGFVAEVPLARPSHCEPAHQVTGSLDLTLDYPSEPITHGPVGLLGINAQKRYY